MVSSSPAVVWLFPETKFFGHQVGLDWPNSLVSSSYPLAQVLFEVPYSLAYNVDYPSELSQGSALLVPALCIMIKVLLEALGSTVKHDL
jgi:hypothetical protein